MRVVYQLIGVVFVLLLGGAGWYLIGQSSDDAQAQGPQGGGPSGGSVPVEVFEASHGSVEYAVEAVGSTLASESVDVVAEVAGRITAIGFEEGERVSQGDMLFELDLAREQAELREAIAQRDDFRVRLRRARVLLQDDDISEAQVDELRAALEGAEARVAVAESRLRERTIRAPFDGVTGLRQISLGAYVSPGTPLTTLDDLSVLRLEFSVPERFLAELRPGLVVQARNIAFQDGVFEGAVVRVGSRVDPVSRSVRVQAELPNEDGSLRSGMFMNARLVLGQRDDAVMIPEQALMPEGQRTYVFVVVDDVARRVEVRTGQRRAGMVEIREGLAQGDLIATAGLQRLRDGATVRVVSSDSESGQVASGPADR
ncbi:MAG: efflux RND transporter periplasmic adaptor subunit [Ectothiorhodospiraceae bacterium]|nr:efflux RND transporter periplasmic adaptor subunit [Ectothiorhodospiraceae bacterium]MCH8505087.1 efflux RND transporter periplasmic adaptor subunit [Ectothiorhodospiraceae bacterium]